MTCRQGRGSGAAFFSWRHTLSRSPFFLSTRIFLSAFSTFLTRINGVLAPSGRGGATPSGWAIPVTMAGNRPLKPRFLGRLTAGLYSRYPRKEILMPRAFRFARRSFLKQAAAAAAAAPMFVRNLMSAPPSGRVRHASFGANGMAGGDMLTFAGHPNVDLVCAAEVDTSRLNLIKERFGRQESQGLPGLARDARQGRPQPGHGQHRHSGSHARADGHVGDAAGPARVRAENRWPTSCTKARRLTEFAPREETDHADGHPDSLQPILPPGSGSDPQRRDPAG